MGEHNNIQDEINQSIWSDGGTLHWLESLQGFTDAGEQASYDRIADEMRNQPILDLGVGAGRTIPLMRAISQNYVAIDYQPEMVAIAKGKYPNVDIQIGDARDLSRFADASFSLVVFSYAGIDAVDHDGRSQIFKEVSRILKPNGVFWFSTLNMEGQELNRRPWVMRWPDNSERIRKFIVNVLRAIKSAAVGTLNYVRLKRYQRRGEGWLVAPFSAHDFGLLVHYTTLSHLCSELEKFCFNFNVEVIDPNGRSLSASDNLSDVYFFNVLARKRADMGTPGIPI
jgi:SAM-dependent methyltransferase